MYVQTARLQAGLEGRELQLSNGTFSKTFRNAGETKSLRMQTMFLLRGNSPCGLLRINRLPGVDISICNFRYCTVYPDVEFRQLENYEREMN